MTRTVFPGGARFAFSIFDDTDVATVDSVRPVYELLSELHLRTTKSTWCFDHDGESPYLGTHTLENQRYVDYLHCLIGRGFEIGFHGATMETSGRTRTSEALQKFREELGVMPRSYAAHAQNRENLYWGVNRFCFPLTRWLYALLSRETADLYQGENRRSAYFWGDLAAAHIDYIRSFTFAELDLTKLSLPLVYRRPDARYANHFFISSDADNVEEFNHALRSENQERLERGGGICIISTHFGKGFVSEGKVNPVTRQLLMELSQRQGWFVPVSEILDFCRESIGCPTLSAVDLMRLEVRWFADSLVRRWSRRGYKVTEAAYLEAAMRDRAGEKVNRSV